MKKYDIIWRQTEKQNIAWQFLFNDKTTEIVFGGGAGGGKILANDGVILTPFGWKKGKELKVGDLINNPDGSIQKIIQIKPEVFLDKWTVIFRDGTSTDVAEDHLWLAWKAGKGRKIKNNIVYGEKSAEVVETRTLKKWLERGYTPQIPVCKPQHFNKITKENNRLDPYLLGVLLGDGCITSSITVSSDKKDIENHYKKEFGFKDITYKDNYFRFIGQKGNDIKNKLKLYGLLGKKSYNKFIPKIYKLGNIKDRKAIIQGMMDTDGYSSPVKNACYYTTISKKLAEDVAFIIRSLGGVVKITKRKAGYKKNKKYIKCNNAYELYIRYPEPDELFRIKRKQKGKFGINLVQKSVVDIKKLGKIKGRCITVSNPNGLYITNDFIVTHNSFLGCAWLIVMCTEYPNTRWLMGRKKLKRLKETTLKTFFEVCRMWGYKEGIHFKYNAQDGNINWANGSEIILADLAYQPSDPNYDELGSLELTGAFIDEVSQITYKCWEIVNARIRYKLDEYGLTPKVLGTCNPSKGWTYTYFYKSYKNNELEERKAFIKALVIDNDFISKHYIAQLKAIKDKNTRERLLNGNWEYDDDPSSLFDFDVIQDQFHQKVDDKKDKWITGDVSRKGRDNMPIGVWHGLQLKKVLLVPYEIRKSTKKSAEWIKKLAQKEGVRFSKIILDEDGVGGGVVDNIEGCIGFVNGSSPILTRKEKLEKKRGEYYVNYGNLKTQCYFKLEEIMEEGLLGVDEDAFEVQAKDDYIEELEQIKQRDADKDGKIYLVGKKEIKENIGRSPDYADMIMMRMLPLIKPKRKLDIITI